MIDRKNELSVRRQCDLLKICRSGVYYEAEPTSTEQLQTCRVQLRVAGLVSVG
ncbi:MAG: hypothetical protein HRU17_20850 [Polyangiaceae bacterium]|nr:hypothetical protein [Polyangiaceae bacterium]